VTQAKEYVVGSNISKVQQELQGEISMFIRVLLKLVNDIIEEHGKTNTIFKTRCKIQGMCCNLIINVGDIEKLVSIEVIENLKLKCTPHSSTYRVSCLQKCHQVTIFK